MIKVLTIIGTRPEAIKMAPVIRALNQTKGPINSAVLNSRQHDVYLVKDTLDLFKCQIDWSLSVLEPGRDLAQLSASLLQNISNVLKVLKPDFVFVHGDTTTAMNAALAAYYNRIPIGHVEAGLRSSRFETPFPEEMNRQIIARLASIHFAPTQKAARNLYDEGVSSNRVFVTGNTIVDALQYVLKNTNPNYNNVFPGGRDLILVTCHRRESWGVNIQKLCETIRRLSIERENYFFVWPVHPNPELQKTVRHALSGLHNVRVTDPFTYQQMVWLLNVVDLVITDSGGVLEEAAVLGRSTLVLREVTERPEALELPGIELVGYDFDLLAKRTKDILFRPPQEFKSDAFGYGDAGEQIVDLLLANFDQIKVDHGRNS